MASAAASVADAPVATEEKLVPMTLEIKKGMMDMPDDYAEDAIATIHRAFSAAITSGVQCGTSHASDFMASSLCGNRSLQSKRSTSMSPALSRNILIANTTQHGMS